jgi:hypothetical protein
LLFLAIMGMISWNLYRRSIFIFGWFVGVLIMNFFLHSFEASYVSILLFGVIWLFMSKKDTQEYISR